jgi:hypothetical protein
MKKIINYTCLLLFYTILISCNSDPLQPEIKPGRRDYVWTIDTIKIPFNNLERLFAISSNNIWAVGHGGGLDQTIWHYDGIKWKTDGISRPIAPIAVYGFSANDIWFGGSEGKIWHYDGSNFSKSLDFRPTTNWTYSGFHDFYGNSSAELYAVGWVDSNKVRYGKIFRFNGYNWKMLNVSSRGDDFMQIRKGNNDQNYYLWSWRFDNVNSDSVKIFSFNGTELREIHRGLMNDTHGAGIETISGRVYFGIDNAVYTYENNAFKQIFAVNNPNFTQGLNGRNEKDIFLSMWDGVAHYNGENIEYIFRENNLVLRDIEVLENEVILLYNDFSKDLSLIYRGKLK